MKKLLRIFPLLCSIGLMLADCSEKDTAPADDTSACTHSASIIGIGPCGKPGYLIALESPRDTVSTYNLPDGLISYTPGVTPVSGRNDGLFAPSAFVKIKMGYSVLAANELTPVNCQGNVNLYPFARMTHGKEVRIVCAGKAP